MLVTSVFCVSLQDFVGRKELGESLGAVESLLKHFSDFENAIAAQEEKIKVGQGKTFYFSC